MVLDAALPSSTKGSTCDPRTDIAPPNKLFFRRRGPVRAFLDHHQLRAGDHVRLTRTGRWTYVVRPERR